MNEQAALGYSVDEPGSYTHQFVTQVFSQRTQTTSKESASFLAVLVSESGSWRVMRRHK